MRLLALVLLFASTPALAVPTCTANPFLGANLRDCLAKIDAGGTIFLADGEHKADAFRITTPVVLRAVNPGKARVAYGGSLLVDLLKSIFNLGETYLLDNSTLFVIDTKGARVRFEGIQFLPPSYRPVPDAAPVTVGRVFQVVDSRLEIANGSLLPEDDDLDGLEDPWTVADTVRAAADTTGGILVLGGPGANIIISGGLYRAVQGEHLVGSLVYVSGLGAQVTFEGAVGVEDGISGAGQVAVFDGAAATVRANADGEPRFERNEGDFGAAIHVGPSATLSVEGGSFARNRARRSLNEGLSTGGAVGVQAGGSVEVSGGSFRGNDAAFGGAIGGFNASVLVTGGEFDANVARFGGHVALLQDPEQAGTPTVTVEGGVWTGGRASLGDAEREENERQGREVYVALGGALALAGGRGTLRNTTFASGFAEGGGGAVGVVNGDLTMVDVEVRANLGPVGAGVALLGGSVDTTRVLFDGNGGLSDSAFGGGLAVVGGSWVDQASTFAENRADRGGGFACGTAESCRLTDTVVSNNEAREGGGGWLLVDEGSIRGVDFRGNVAREAGGHLAAGAGALDDGSVVAGRLRVEDGAFRDGEAGDAGGAWSMVGTSVTALGVVWEANRTLAADGVGGAVFAVGGQLSVTGGDLLRNEAAFGGGILATEATLDLADGRVVGNVAGQGGGVVVAGGSGGSVVRQLFCGNRASEVGSALVVSDDQGGDVPFLVSNNLFDGLGGQGIGLLWVQRREAALEQNNFVRGVNGAVRAVDAQVVARRNLFAWHGGPFVFQLENTVVDGEENLFFDADRADDAWINGAPTPPEALRGDPRLRGYLPGEPDDCAWDDHHPRPSSPLLIGGWPTVADAAHIGVFGGPSRVAEPWSTDADVDASPRIFDCDDRDETVPERRAQFVDADGDGVGGAGWPGDECELVQGNATEGGDCDDQDPSRITDCSPLIRYYGATCSATGGGVGWSGFFALWLAFRARRPRRM